MRRNIVFNSLILNRVLWVFIVLISGSNSIFANDPFIILGCDSVQFTADSTADHLVINENYYLDNLQAYNVDMDEYWIFGEYPTRDYVFFYTETSVVWEKKDGKWKIASPYYASIEKCSLGYLVRTGVFERINKNTGETEVVNEARTLLLDHHLKPIPFLDYFDFGDGIAYDFGVSLCTQNGCFLIANNGKVITNDEWDLFELENGRVKAIRFKAIDPDLFWEFDPDDNIDTFEYFDLPTN